MYIDELADGVGLNCLMARLLEDSISTLFSFFTNHRHLETFKPNNAPSFSRPPRRGLSVVAVRVEVAATTVYPVIPEASHVVNLWSSELDAEKKLIVQPA